jgi:hypothetical protein
MFTQKSILQSRNAHSLRITTHLYCILSNVLLKQKRNKVRCYDQNKEWFYPHTNHNYMYNKYKEYYLGWVGGPFPYQQGIFKINLKNESFYHTHKFHEQQFISLLHKQVYNQQSSRIKSTT